jgi:plastocyanin
MKLSRYAQIIAGLAGGALVIVGLLVAVVLASPTASATAGAAQAPALSQPPAQVNLVIVPGVRLGPDNKMHDAFTPTDMSATVGQKVTVTVYNYDTAKHTFTAPALHLNVIMAGARREGVPAVTTFSFTVDKAGAYHWLCTLPCDDAKGWAMLHDHYMAGTVTITQ